MSEIRERLEEIQKLASDSAGKSILDVLGEIHEDATKALALLDGADPVAWMVQHHGDEGVQYVELWTRKHRAESQVESLRKGYPEDRFSITPLFVSPAPAPALTGLERAALQRLHDDIHVIRHKKGYETGEITVHGTVVLEAKNALARLLASPTPTQALEAASEPTPEALRAWAEWFDNPGKSPAIVVGEATPGMLLRQIADEMRRLGALTGQEGDDEAT